jgi:metal-responsive CopG/Arc/MetJ family transcriptional regulator
MAYDHMRTTLDIPEDLLRAVTEIVGVKKRNEAVRIALSDFTRRKRATPGATRQTDD